MNANIYFLQFQQPSRFTCNTRALVFCYSVHTNNDLSLHNMLIFGNNKKGLAVHFGTTNPEYNPSCVPPTTHKPPTWFFISIRDYKIPLWGLWGLNIIWSNHTLWVTRVQTMRGSDCGKQSRGALSGSWEWKSDSWLKCAFYGGNDMLSDIL